nr:hypothetical protein 1 [Bacillaceae bacterium]
MKSPAEWGIEKITDNLKEGMADFAADYISAFPILIGVSIGVYALISMFSSKLAKMGVIGVFLYGALIIFI